MPKYRMVTLPNGRKKRMSEGEIRDWLDFSDMQGGTVSIGAVMYYEAASKRAKELNITKETPHDPNVVIISIGGYKDA